MKKICCILPVALLLLSHSVFAGVASGWGTITEFYISADGKAMRLKFSEPIKNPGDSCGAGDFYMKELDDSMGSNRFYSAVLAAYTSQKQVQFWVLGCTNIAWWGHTRPTLHEISIKD